METIKATQITAGMTITYAGDTATVVEVKADNSGFGFDLLMDNGEEWFIFAGMFVQAETLVSTELRSGYEVKAGWKVQTAKHGIITVTDKDCGQAAGTNGMILEGVDALGNTVYERRSRFASIIRYI